MLDESVVASKYAAEAAAKIGLDMLINNNQTSANLLNQSLFGTTTYDLRITDNLLTNNFVIINSTARTVNSSSRAQVRVLYSTNNINSPPGLSQLLNEETASFSNGPWRFSGTPPRANPPDGRYHQVLFNDRINENFRIEYTATLGQRVNTRESATGYGIYYFASGTPNNMTAYVFQYDPGAFIGTSRNNDGGAFFVKKVIASNPPNSGGPWCNETRDYRLGFADDDRDNTIRVSLNDLRDIMRKTPGHENFDKLNQPHKITIVRILSFVDNDTANPIPTTNTGTGLRTWNARVDFFPGDSEGQDPPRQIIWQNPN